MSYLPWRDAMERALYGPEGFFVREGGGPAAHFRTSVHASPLFAGAVLELARRVDEALDRPERLTVCDVGAGRGELLVALGAQARAVDPELADRLRLVAVERAARPEGLPAWVSWADRIEPVPAGLLFANEWLDNVPCEVAEVDEEGVARYVLVDPASGAERPGEPLDAADAAWLRDAFPHPVERAELGRWREQAWSQAVAAVGDGLAVAVDYAHTRTDRPPFGTLTGYQGGRQVDPVPDGSCDLTAHVALDSCLAAAARANPRVTHSLWTTQRAALHELGVSGSRPPLALASSDPVGYLRALAGAGEAAELTATGGLGSFLWGVQAVGSLRMVWPQGWQTLMS
ncbi:SAM-dependent methyltransferase [Streptacidiphilus jiangxiensis]|uniref:SAM-dependent methyltransferase, MidA family n=1 Tax=Streptacidiphilus jiangxiensis TaxID=235985 RepID=A0A1H7Q0H0_STRJI|nr:SAM-dependent methyltransferase [Streptacidiphilus jiangxiensis]SEL41218.1 SAM-dependent methyltransferase, MidA family [Streptacidiphilus jiangxiensis]